MSGGSCSCCSSCSGEQGRQAAGECYLAWADAHPKELRAPEGYYNAFVFLAPTDSERASEVSERLAARYPESALVPRALFQSSQLLERLERFASAAEVDERLVREYPKTREAGDALYNAAVLRLRTGDCARARAAAKVLASRSRKDSQEARVAGEVLARCPP